MFQPAEDFPLALRPSTSSDWDKNLARSKTLIDEVLMAGDLLYIPFGFAHDAVGANSLHAPTLHLNLGVETLHSSVLELLRHTVFMHGDRDRELKQPYGLPHRQTGTQPRAQPPSALSVLMESVGSAGSVEGLRIGGLGADIASLRRTVPLLLTRSRHKEAEHRIHAQLLEASTVWTNSADTRAAAQRLGALPDSEEAKRADIAIHTFMSELRSSLIQTTLDAHSTRFPPEHTVEHALLSQALYPRMASHRDPSGSYLQSLGCPVTAGETVMHLRDCTVIVPLGYRLGGGPGGRMFLESIGDVNLEGPMTIVGPDNFIQQVEGGHRAFLTDVLTCNGPHGDRTFQISELVPGSVERSIKLAKQLVQAGLLFVEC